MDHEASVCVYTDSIGVDNGLMQARSQATTKLNYTAGTWQKWILDVLYAAMAQIKRLIVYSYERFFLNDTWSQNRYITVTHSLSLGLCISF